MIKPTNGRIVWYWCYAINQTQPKPAMITWVHDDERVNLTVFDPTGESYGQADILLWQGEGERPTVPHCEWMPYQKGQAAKTESLEKQINQGYIDK